MNNTLDLTINLEVFQLTKEVLRSVTAIAKVIGVPEECVLSLTLFRSNRGFVGVVTSINRRLNLKAIMKELDSSWVAYPSDEEWGELGVLDRSNPFAIANNPSVEMIIDARVIHQKNVAFVSTQDHAIRAAMSSLVVGTKAKVLGGISL